MKPRTLLLIQVADAQSHSANSRSGIVAVDAAKIVRYVNCRIKIDPTGKHLNGKTNSMETQGNSMELAFRMSNVKV